MFSYKHYVPILKGKDGEFRALELLPTMAKRNITPFIDITRQEPDFTTGRPREKIEVYLAKKAKKIRKAWSLDRELFVDVFDLDLGLRTSSGVHFSTFLFSCLRTLQVKSVPVIGLDRSEDIDYINAIAEIASTDKFGVCIRLLQDDLESSKETYNHVSDLVRALGLSRKGTDMLMDFRSLSMTDIDEVADTATGFLANLPNTMDWRTITLSASGFPQDLGGISPSSIDAVPRTEFDLRFELSRRGRKIRRMPTFSDYGICHPDILDFDPRYTPSAAIRYTIEREWLVLKARSVKRYTYSQFRVSIGIQN